MQICIIYCSNVKNMYHRPKTCAMPIFISLCNKEEHNFLARLTLCTSVKLLPLTNFVRTYSALCYMAWTNWIAFVQLKNAIIYDQLVLLLEKSNHFNSAFFHLFCAKLKHFSCNFESIYKGFYDDKVLIDTEVNKYESINNTIIKFQL